MKLKGTGKLKVVIDTNTIISAPFSEDGNPAKIFELLLLEKILNFTSDDIIAEIKGVFARSRILKYISAEKINFIIENYLKFSVKVNPQIKLSIITDDPDDNIVLECAENAKVDFVISGDKHLKDLKEYKGIRILSAAKFLDL